MTVIGFIGLALAAAPAASAPAIRWIPLAPGADYAAVSLEEKAAPGDGLLHVVRVDPHKATLRFGLSARDGGPHTAAEWVSKQGFVAAINPGMFEPDGTSTGYLRDGAFVGNPRWNQYQSALGFSPGSAALFDLDAPPGRARAAQFPSVVQGLRLLKGHGESVWKHSAKRWSESAIAVDREGCILMLFSRTPFSMPELLARLTAIPDLAVQRAMHVEGGPEASLSVRGPGLKLDLAGSYETGFHEDDSNDHQWPIPNVLGVRPR
jgi:hypothetical protein